MKTTYEKVKDILGKPHTGHPSRKTKTDIQNIKEAVLELAKEASYANR